MGRRGLSDARMRQRHSTMTGRRTIVPTAGASAAAVAAKAAAAAVVACALLAAATVTAGAGSDSFSEDFSKCAVGGKPTSDVWSIPNIQWGGDNVNGGVSPDNVQCVTDSTLGKTVLQLTANGDQYTGNGPIGILKNGQPRASDAEFTGWTWGLYKNPCTPYCNVRRVGGALETKQGFEGGHLKVHMKPCQEMGVASAIWLFNYTEHYCDTSSSTCSPAYQQWCCGGVACTPANDVCQGAWYENLEIDIEMPTSDTSVQPRAIDPQWINYHNMRFSSYTALPSGPHVKCGSTSPCAEEDYEWIGKVQNDGEYHTYELMWDPANGDLKFSVDGVQKSDITGHNKVPHFGHLWLGAWFPDSWTGSPNFTQCNMLVDSITFEPLSAIKGRNSSSRLPVVEPAAPVKP